MPSTAGTDPTDAAVSAGPTSQDGRVVLDAAAAAPPLPEAVQAWQAAVADGWADPRRLHLEARRSRILLDGAREAIAGLTGARAQDVAFPPDHVRALHAAVLGCSGPGAVVGPVVVGATEHSAVHHAAGWRADDDLRPRVVPVDGDGLLDLDALAAALPGARLAVVQHANVEIGTTQHLAAVHDRCRQAGVPLLVDAGASLGHLPAPTEYDVLVGSPRAWGSVPGAAVLVTRAGVRWRPHEPGEAGAARRPGEHAGEVDVPAALAAAVSLQAVAPTAGTADPRHALVELVRRAAAAVPDTVVVGHPTRRLPHVVTLSALFVPGEELVRAFDGLGLAVGSGSACTADTLRPSHVLAAVGALTHGNVRLGLPRGTTQADVERFCDALPRVVARLRDDLGASGL